LTNFVRIWSLLVGLTKCAAHLGKRAAQLAKCARIWPNVAQMRAVQLAKCARNLPNVAHLVKCAAHLPKCADWSNAPYSITVYNLPLSAHKTPQNSSKEVRLSALHLTIKWSIIVILLGGQLYGRHSEKTQAKLLSSIYIVEMLQCALFMSNNCILKFLH